MGHPSIVQGLLEGLFQPPEAYPQGGAGGEGGQESGSGEGIPDRNTPGFQGDGYWGPRVADPSGYWGPNARAFEGQSRKDIRDNSRRIQAGRDLSRAGLGIPVVEHSSTTAPGDVPGDTGYINPPGQGIPNVFLLPTEQGMVPVQDPGYWPRADQPVFAPPSDYQPYLNQYHAQQRAAAEARARAEAEERAKHVQPLDMRQQRGAKKR